MDQNQLKALTRRVLFVEADPVLAGAYEQRLTLCGHHLVVCHQVDEAVQNLSTLHFDVVVIDLRDNRDDGVALVEAMRRAEGLKNTPVLFLAPPGLCVDSEKILQLKAEQIPTQTTCCSRATVQAIHELLRKHPLAKDAGLRLAPQPPLESIKPRLPLEREASASPIPEPQYKHETL